MYVLNLYGLFAKMSRAKVSEAGLYKLPRPGAFEPHVVLAALTNKQANKCQTTTYVILRVLCFVLKLVFVVGPVRSVSIISVFEIPF